LNTSWVQRAIRMLALFVLFHFLLMFYDYEDADLVNMISYVYKARMCLDWDGRKKRC
jgi:hypothetical protein